MVEHTPRLRMVLLLAGGVAALTGCAPGPRVAEPELVTTERAMFELSGAPGERIVAFQGVWVTPSLAADGMIDLVDYRCSEQPSRCLIGNAALWKGRLSVTPELVEPVEWRADQLVIRTMNSCTRLTVTVDLESKAVTAATDDAPGWTPSCGEPLTKPEVSRLEDGPLR